MERLLIRLERGLLPLLAALLAFITLGIFIQVFSRRGAPPPFRTSPREDCAGKARARSASTTRRGPFDRSLAITNDTAPG
jgi:hypothetical protein